MSEKYILLTFKGICMNFLLEFKKIILSHPVTSKQPHKIVQIHWQKEQQSKAQNSDGKYRQMALAGFDT